MRRLGRVAGLLVALMLVVSGSVYAKAIEITLWHMETPSYRVEIFQKVLDRFNKANPDIVVRQKAINWEEAYAKSVAAIQSGNAPDLLFTNPDMTTTIRQTGAGQPVDDLVAMLDKKYDLIDSAASPYRWDGHYWAVPTYNMVQVLWYRADLFKKAGLDPDRPPRTWAELLQYAQKLQQSGVYGIGLPASKHFYTDQVLFSFLITGGAEHLFDEKGRIAFDNPNTVKVFQYYKDLFKYAPPDATSWTWAEPMLALTTGTVAMTFEKGEFTGPWEEQSGTPASNLRIAPYPWPEGGKRGSTAIPNGVMVLTKDAQKRAAIQRFFTYLYEPETNGEWLNMEPGLFLPVSKATLNSKSYWSHPIISKYASAVRLMVEQTEYAKYYGFTRDFVDPNVGRIGGEMLMSQALQKMIVEGMSPADAVKWGAEQMRKAVGHD